MKTKIKDFLINILIIISLIIITFLICIKSPINIFSDAIVSHTDSNVFKYIGLSMTKGYIPYLDIFDHKGLLLYFINYIGVIISPTIGIWIIEFICMFISVLFSYKIARKFVSKPISLLIVIIAFIPMYDYFEGGNFTEEYALPFQIIGLYIIFDYFLNPKKYSSQIEKRTIFRTNFKLFNIPVFICGICCASVVFLRVNMISIWIVFSIMILIHCIANKKYIELTKMILSFLCGVLLVTSLMLIYLIKNGALESFINDYILFNLKYSDSIRKVTKINTLMFFFDTTIIEIAFIIIVMKICIQIKNKEKWYFNLGYLFYMIITLLLISLSGRTYLHYGMNIIPMLIYPYCIMYKFLDKEEIKKVGIHLIITAYLLFSIIIPKGIQFVTDSLKIIFSDNKIEYSQRIVDYIVNNTEEDDSISVLGNSCNYYILTNRKSASKYFYQIPIAEIDKEIMKEYIDELKENKPKIIIWGIANSSYKELEQQMTDFLSENNYKLVEDGLPIYELEK